MKKYVALIEVEVESELKWTPADIKTGLEAQIREIYKFTPTIDSKVLSVEVLEVLKY